MNLPRPLLLLLVSLMLGQPATAVVGPQLKDSSPGPEAPPATKPEKKTEAPAKPKPHKSAKTKRESIDQIKGIGKFVIGAKLTDYAAEELRIIDPKAKGTLLRVSPYGTNYLVRDVSGLTWGNIPIEGLILTFNDNVLIDIQIALKARKIDFYLAQRAFKDKYGPCHSDSYPVQAWNGDRIHVTLVMIGAQIDEASTFDAPAQGKLEILDAARWKKIDDAQAAKLNETLDQRYETDAGKVKTNL